MSLSMTSNPISSAERACGLQVPFEQVPDLVAARRVLLRGGAAFVSRHEVASLVMGHFRAGLSHSLALTARRWVASVAEDEAERLTPIVLSLSERCSLGKRARRPLPQPL